MAGKSGGAWVPGPLGTSAPLWDSGPTENPDLCSTEEGAGWQGGRDLQEAWLGVLGVRGEQSPHSTLRPLRCKEAGSSCGLLRADQAPGLVSPRPESPAALQPAWEWGGVT